MVITTGVRGSATRGYDERGALQRWPEELGAWGHARRPSARAPNWGGCCLAVWHLRRRHIRASRSPAPLHTPTSTRRTSASTAAYEPCVDFYDGEGPTGTRSVPLAYGGAVRNAMWGFSGVPSDNRQDSNHRRLGARSEGRLAWPPPPSPSGHLCKAPRPRKPRVGFRTAPSHPLELVQGHLAFVS